ncbi:transcriptional regulator [Candidatus Geothermarchaeota archaeon]|nr:MAG: transcriptional regulator [Candidatus Geothermarchaeota archaeon]
MNKDQILGAGVLIGSILGIIAYFWLIFMSPWSALVIQVTIFAAVAAILGILAWIGYTLATTPPPKPIEEIEKELEKELKEMETETKEKEKSEV